MFTSLLWAETELAEVPELVSFSLPSPLTFDLLLVSGFNSQLVLKGAVLLPS